MRFSLRDARILRIHNLRSCTSLHFGWCECEGVLSQSSGLGSLLEEEARLRSILPRQMQPYALLYLRRINVSCLRNFIAKNITALALNYTRGKTRFCRFARRAERRGWVLDGLVAALVRVRIVFLFLLTTRSVCGTLFAVDGERDSTDGKSR